MQPPQRPSPLRVLAVLRPGDQSLLAGLATNHCVVVGTALDTLDRTVGIERANAVVVDVDLQGAFEAVGRLRRVGGLAGSVPVAFVGAPELSSLVADFLQRSGPGFFASRPVVAADLAQRLRNLHELGVQQHRATSTSGAVKSLRNSPPTGTPRLTHTTPPRTTSPQPFSPPLSPLRGPTTPPLSAMRAPTPVPGALSPQMPPGSSPQPPIESASTLAASQMTTPLKPPHPQVNPDRTPQSRTSWLPPRPAVQGALQPAFEAQPAVLSNSRTTQLPVHRLLLPLSQHVSRAATSA